MKACAASDFDTVFDSQQVFRCLLQAAARPGRLCTLPPFGCGPLEAVARTLLDQEVTFCAIGERAGEVEDRVSRVTGARLAAATEAGFALVSGGDSAGAVLGLERGTLEHPERGATAIYAVETLSDTGTLSLELSGPGVPATRTLGVAGLAAEEIRVIRDTRLDYPLGIDVYLIDDSGRVAGLPRSTQLKDSA